MLSLTRDKPSPSVGRHKSRRRPPPRINALLFPDVSLHPLLATALTLLLLFVFTWAIRSLRLITHDSRPYSMLYLIPVAFGGAFMGLRGGLATALGALLLAKLFVFNAADGYLHFSSLSNSVEFGVLVLGIFFIASITGRLHNVIRDLHRVHTRLLHSEERRQTFSREVLLAVTGGRLLLCDQAELIATITGQEALSFALKNSADVGALRHSLQRVVAKHHLNIRLDDLFTCATEAGANAIKHGNGGTAKAWAGKDEICLMISDHGPGISPANLARATLERGFSTETSLGMGFMMMLDAVDSLVLSTSEQGTTVLLRVSGRPRTSVEDDLLARFSMEAGR